MPIATLHAGRVKRLAGKKDGPGFVGGIASTFGTEPDLQGDAIAAGAFHKTIAERGGKLPLMIRHLSSGGGVAESIGIVTELNETSKGLTFRAKFFSDELSQSVRTKIREMLASGYKPGVSIGYAVIQSRPGGKGEPFRRLLTEVKLFELTITLTPANSDAMVTDAKGRPKKKPKSSAPPAVQKTAEEIRAHAARVTKEVNAMSESAKAVDHESKTQAHYQILQRFMTAGDDSAKAMRTLSDNERKEFGPTNPKHAGKSLRLPPDVFAAVFRGHPGVSGKALLSDLSGSNTSRADLLVHSETFPPRYLGRDVVALDSVSILPAHSGHAIIPAIARADGVELGGLNWQWYSDQSVYAKPSVEPIFDAITIDTYELAGHCSVSLRLLRQVPGLQDFLRGLFAQSMRAVIDRAIISGTGPVMGQPLGVANDASVRTVARQTAGSVSAMDAANLRHSVQPSHRTGAVFLAETDTEHLLRTQQDAGAAFTLSPWSAERLWGHSLTASEQLPTIGDEGDLLFGAWRHYALAVEGEILLQYSDHEEFRNDRRSFRMMAFVGGRAIFGPAFALLSDAAS